MSEEHPEMSNAPDDEREPPEGSSDGDEPSKGPTSDPPQQKFFDSGDYQMYKQQGKLGFNKLRGAGLNQTMAQPTGEAIPTPETVPARKASIIQHTKFNPVTST
ncbi:unnamed protein product [Darwinula stevensoni]|uniref:Alpha-endosulfine n=1 Tax=Darwinula stevensoni TaxID=69355 RepID=A0A7R9AF02_9CRUS|nr:unnamed protein product [Darwinula stevensoni]CAG0902825.1 unnamed protein product [Darwinula stevensoni]